MTGEIGDVCARVRAEHERLRGVLETLAPLAARVATGSEADVDRLRELGLELYDRMTAHLAMEDSELLPLVRKAGAWGDRCARQLGREHAEQRMLLEYIIARLRDERRPPAVLGADLASFAELLCDDMDDEERSVLAHGALAGAAGTPTR